MAISIDRMKRFNLYILIFLALIALVGASIPCNAQLKYIKRLFHNNYDSTYINDHSQELTLRYFFTTNAVSYEIGDNKYSDWLIYKPNEQLGVGLGFNYRFLGLNLSFKFPDLQNNNDKYGKTTHLNLRSFIYLRKITIDLYGEFYKGYYLSDPQLIKGWQPDNGYYKRPDLITGNIGVDFVYQFNYKKFSYRAVYLQNEYQKKSAGSFLLGAGLRSKLSVADSAIIPHNMTYPDFWDNLDFRKSSSTGVTVNVGYAHTFVIKKHFFITASLIPGIGLNVSKLNGSAHANTTGLLINNNARFAAGYNSEKYFIGLYYINFISRDNIGTTGNWLQYATGNFHLTFAMRFNAKKLF